MPATRYKLWHFASNSRGGVCETADVRVEGVAKRSTADMEFVVVNELVCNLLARAILLPTPPGFIVEREDVPYYVSLNFNLSGQSLPPIQPAKVASEKLGICAGIVVFDAWVCNRDRHINNIHYDSKTKKIEVFDHSHALLGVGAIEQFLGLDCQSCLEDHCLVPFLPELNPMRQWFERIAQIPEYYVKECFKAAVSVGLPEEYAEPCAEKLLSRRKKLLQLIRDDKVQFRAARDALTFGS